VAKKKDQSLTDRIAALINRVGEKPAPGMDVIKSALVPCLSLAESLEEGAAIRDAETQITVLEAALEKSDAEIGKLQGELQSLNTEVEAFRAERKKQQEEERKREIPPIQFKILKMLPTEHGGGLIMEEIAKAAKIPFDEAELYLGALESAKLVSNRYNALAVIIWYRTKTGNSLVVAKRWAGEAQPDGKKRKHADLSKPEEIALVMMTRDGGEGATEPEIAKELGISVLAVTLVLATLRGKNMATDGDEPQESYGTGQTWWLLKAGKEYLDERGLL
jgi:predicted transcriptional regulator